MPLVYRLIKGSKLTIAEMDGNFQFLDAKIDSMSGGGGSQNFQQVTDIGNSTDKGIVLLSTSLQDIILWGQDTSIPDGTNWITGTNIGEGDKLYLFTKDSTEGLGFTFTSLTYTNFGVVSPYAAITVIGGDQSDPNQGGLHINSTSTSGNAKVNQFRANGGNIVLRSDYYNFSNDPNLLYHNAAILCEDVAAGIFTDYSDTTTGGIQTTGFKMTNVDYFNNTNFSFSFLKNNDVIFGMVKEGGEYVAKGIPVKMKWDTANRPATPHEGDWGYNTDLHSMEYWNGTTWLAY